VPQLDKYIFFFEIRNLSIVFLFIYWFIRYTVVSKTSFFLKFKRRKEKEINWLQIYFTRQYIGVILWLYKKDFMMFRDVQVINVMNLEKYKKFINANLANIYKIFDFFKIYNNNYILYHYCFSIYRNLLSYISTINSYIALEIYNLEPFYINKIQLYDYIKKNIYVEYLGLKVFGSLKQFFFIKNFVFSKKINFSRFWNLEKLLYNEEFIRLY